MYEITNWILIFRRLCTYSDFLDFIPNILVNLWGDQFFHVQNIQENWMAWADWYANIPCNFLCSDSTIFKSNFIYRFDVFLTCWRSRTSSLFCQRTRVPSFITISQFLPKLQLAQTDGQTGHQFNLSHSPDHLYTTRRRRPRLAVAYV